MPEETDAAFVKRMLRAIDEQTPADDTPAPRRVSLDSTDLMRLVKLYAGIPATAIQVN